MELPLIQRLKVVSLTVGNTEMLPIKWQRKLSIAHIVTIHARSFGFDACFLPFSHSLRKLENTEKKTPKKLIITMTSSGTAAYFAG